MNKIFKVVWSKVRNCYVVVSEIAKNTVSGIGKRNRVNRLSLGATLAAAVLTGGFFLPSEGLAGTDNLAEVADFNQYIVIEQRGWPSYTANNNVVSKNEGNVTYYEVTYNGATNTYYAQSVNGKTFYVLKGYEIVSWEEQASKANASEKVTVVTKIKGNSANNNVLSTLQHKTYWLRNNRGNVLSTVVSDSLNDVHLTSYAAVTNGGGVVTPKNWGYNFDWDGDKVTESNERLYLKENKQGNTQMIQVSLSSDGNYYYNNEIVPVNNVYFLSDNETSISSNDVNAYIFVKDGKVYDRLVYGDNGEILLTGLDKNGVAYTYWGAEADDHNTLLRDSGMTIHQLHETFDALQENDENLSYADVKRITLRKDGNGGTIGLEYNDANKLANGQASTVEGSLSFEEHGGTSDTGDTYIRVSQDNNTFFDLSTGSKVVANNGNGGTVLSKLSVNGQVFDVVNTDYRLIPGGATFKVDENITKTGYVVGSDGTVDLKVQNGTDTNNAQTVTVGNVASKDKLDEVIGKVDTGWNLKVESEQDGYNVKPVNGKNTVTLESNDENLTVNRSGGVVTFGFSDTPNFTSVNVGNGSKVVLSDTGINMNNSNIVGLAKGVDNNHAANVGQLPDVNSGSNDIIVTTDTNDDTGKTTYSVSFTGKYVNDASYDNKNKILSLELNDGTNLLSADLSGIVAGLSSTDHRLVKNVQADSNGEYRVGSTGEIELIVANPNGTTDANSNVKITGIASKEVLDDVAGKVASGWNLKAGDNDTDGYDVTPANKNVALKSRDANLEITRSNGEVTFAVKNMRVTSGEATYLTTVGNGQKVGDGTITLTNGDGTTATITNLHDYYAAGLSVQNSANTDGSKDLVLTLNNGETVSVALSDITAGLGTMSSWKATIGSTTFDVINGETVEYIAGSNISLSADASQKITIATTNSVTFDSITINGTNNTNNVIINADGINAGSKVITNVAAGVNVSDAVNVSQLKSVINSEKHLVKNQADGSDGHYKVINDSVTLNVIGKDGSGQDTYTDVVIDDVASARNLAAVKEHTIREFAITGGYGIGTINLIRENNSIVPGGLTFSSGGGTSTITPQQSGIDKVDSHDTFIQISNDDGSIVLNAGSVVRGNYDGVSSNTYALHNIYVNGVTYTLPSFNDLAESLTDFHLSNGSITLGDYVKKIDANTQQVYTNITGYKVNEEGMVQLEVLDNHEQDTDHFHGHVYIGNIATKTQQDTNTAQLKGTVMYDYDTSTQEYDYSSIELGETGSNINGTATTDYQKNADGTYTGGVKVTNVAYAEATEGNSGYNGSAAVNVDLLNDKINEAVIKANQTAETQDKFLIANPDSNSGGAYTVNNNKITLKVNNSTDVVINDVASATDLGKVTDLHSSLKNNNSNETTSVVGAVNKLNDKVGDISDYSSNKYITDGESLAVSIGKLDAAINDASATAGKHSSVSNGDSNIVIDNSGQNANGGVDYKVSLSKDVNVKETLTVGASGDKQIVVNGNEGTIKVGAVNVSAAGNVTGLTNVSWDETNISSGQAATEDQVQAATKNVIRYDNDTKDKVTFAGNGDGTTLTNVAKGEISETSKDAVNGGQLFATNQVVMNNYENIQNLSAQNQQLDSRINQVNSRVNKVGAGAAALAALHPMDFDPDDKLSFAVGAGNYAGENATALGAFYRPNEKVMMSVGGTYGNGENMVNMGVSFALDRTNNVSNSRTAMAKEIVDLREQVATQGQQIAQLVALVQQLAGVQQPVVPAEQLFPDVPQNHWAYEYVNGLVAKGIIEGYPDGTFGGDRAMTRYEFAAMLFRAMEQGVVLNEQIRQEFEPELGRIRVDRVKGTDADLNKIERVRVNTAVNRDDYGTKVVQVKH